MADSDNVAKQIDTTNNVQDITNQVLKDTSSMYTAEDINRKMSYRSLNQRGGDRTYSAPSRSYAQ